ncbi:MAG: PEP-CTERM sorting domain-containing protein [Chloroflexaceae bacterium]|nr:PEP-CTERM sorting domain-containing protein [Chloroflexaceae bacterium]
MADVYRGFDHNLGRVVAIKIMATSMRTQAGLNERFQFTVDLTGRENIGVSFDQASSSTGPRDFTLAYQVNGGGFINFASYVVLPNQVASPGLGNWTSTTAIPGYTFTFDLSSVTEINNAAVVDFALINTSTVSATGTTVAANGTSRVDNFTVSVVPEPGSMVMIAVAGVGGFVARRRMKKAKLETLAC